MGAFSNAVETAVLNHILGNAAYTQPAGQFVALFTVMPGEDGSGGTEAEWTGYERQAASFGNASAGNPSTCANDAEVDFGDPDEDLELVGFGIYTADTGGTLMILQAFDEPVIVQAAVTEAVAFPVGALVVELD